MGKYDALKCAQVRKLIEDNKYKKALESIDNMEMSQVTSMADLNLFAQVYEKADRLDEAKEILYYVYETTKSKRSLYRLIKLVYRMNNIKEAKELYLEYELANGINLDTYELRYGLAKMEGAPREARIHILEDLKRDEFTEEWGYKLAMLYALEGHKEKCIQTCHDLKVWFSDGSYVEKAQILAGNMEIPGWKPEGYVDDDEPVEKETKVFYERPIINTKMTETLPPEPKEMKPAVVQVAEGFQSDLPEEETKAVGAPVIFVAGEAERELEPLTKEEAAQMEATQMEAAQVNHPEFQDGDEPEAERKTEPEPEVADEPDAEPEPYIVAEEDIYLSDNGISYYTLRDALGLVHDHKGSVNFVITGSEERIVLAVSKKLVKELNRIGYFDVKSFAKISADKFNHIDLKQRLDKLAGSCVYVSDASALNDKSWSDIYEVMKDGENQISFIFTDEFDVMDCVLSKHADAEGLIPYKIRL